MALPHHPPVRSAVVAALGVRRARLVVLLQQIVAARCNVLVSGATSSGKTTLLNALAALVPATERIITLEDIAELRLAHPHVVRLETRPPSAEGAGEITLNHLLRTALRMRPDRLVLGEVRGAEAVQLVQAMNTGHDGSMSTVHANSAVDAVARLCSLVLQEVPGWPLEAIHDQVRRSIDVVDPRRPFHRQPPADHRGVRDRSGHGQCAVASSGRPVGGGHVAADGRADDHGGVGRHPRRVARRAGGAPAAEFAARSFRPSCSDHDAAVRQQPTTRRCSTRSPARFAAAPA